MEATRNRLGQFLEGVSYNYDEAKHTTYECLNCKTSFDGLISIPRIYCSKVCRAKNKTGTAASNWKGGKLERDCKNCGEGFVLEKYRESTAEFCSHSCVAKSIEFTPERRKSISLMAKKRVEDGTWKNQHGGYKGGYENKLMHNRNRRIKEKNIVGTHSLEDWIALKIKYGFTCLMCKLTEPEITLSEDHIIPLSKNGTNYITNIQPLCRGCNSRKYNKVLNLIPL